MKSQLIITVLIVLASFSSFPSNLTNAQVICVDKYNNTSVIPCSDRNAIDKSSVNTGHEANLTNTASLKGANLTAGNMTNSTTSNVINSTGSPFITNSSSDCERGKNAGKIDAGSDLSSHSGYDKTGHNYANEGQHFLSCYSTAYDQEYARLQFGHQQNSSSSVISSSQQQNQTCDKVGYASCYSMGYSGYYYNSESFGCLPPIVLNSTQNHNYCLGYLYHRNQSPQYQQELANETAARQEMFQQPIGAGNALFNSGIPNTQGTSSPQPIKQNTKASGCGTAVINGTLTSYCLNSPVIQPHSDTGAAQSNSSLTSSGRSQEPVAKQNDRYYEGLNWWGVCNNPLLHSYISQSCDVLVTPDKNALTFKGKVALEGILCPRGPSIVTTLQLFYGPIPQKLKNDLAVACGWQ
jgi:hypothetical protein